MVVLCKMQAAEVGRSAALGCRRLATRASRGPHHSDQSVGAASSSRNSFLCEFKNCGHDRVFSLVEATNDLDHHRGPSRKQRHSHRLSFWATVIDAPRCFRSSDSRPDTAMTFITWTLSLAQPSTSCHLSHVAAPHR